MSAEPRIAIVGIGGLFPGSRTLDQYWHNIVNAVDCSRPVPPGRWLLDPADAIADGTATEDHIPHSRAYYLDEIPQETTDLAIDAAWLARMDPVFHLILLRRDPGVSRREDGVDRSLARRRHTRPYRPAERKVICFGRRNLGSILPGKTGNRRRPSARRAAEPLCRRAAGGRARAVHRPGRRHIHARCGLRARRFTR